MIPINRNLRVVHIQLKLQDKNINNSLTIKYSEKSVKQITLKYLRFGEIINLKILIHSAVT